MSKFEKYSPLLGMICCGAYFVSMGYGVYEDKRVAFQVMEKLPEGEFVALCGIDDVTYKDICLRVFHLKNGDINKLGVGGVYVGNVSRSEFNNNIDKCIEISNIKCQNCSSEVDFERVYYIPNETMDMMRKQALDNVKNNILFTFGLNIIRKDREGVFVDIEDETNKTILKNGYIQLDSEKLTQLDVGLKYTMTLKVGNPNGLELVDIQPVKKELPFRKLPSKDFCKPLKSVQFQILEKKEDARTIEVIVYDQKEGDFRTELDASNGLFHWLKKGEVYRGKLRGNFIYTLHETCNEKPFYEISYAPQVNSQQNALAVADRKDLKMTSFFENDDAVSLKFPKANLNQKTVSCNKVNIPQMVYERDIIRA